MKTFFFFFFFGDRLKNFCEDLFFFYFGEHLRFVSLVLGLGLEHSCPWPRECLSSERLSLALASDFFCVLGLGLGLEPCVLDSTSDRMTGSASLFHMHALLESDYAFLTYILHLFVLCRGPKGESMA